MTLSRVHVSSCIAEARRVERRVRWEKIHSRGWAGQDCWSTVDTLEAALSIPRTFRSSGCVALPIFAAFLESLWLTLKMYWRYCFVALSMPLPEIPCKKGHISQCLTSISIAMTNLQTLEEQTLYALDWLWNLLMKGLDRMNLDFSSLPCSPKLQSGSVQHSNALRAAISTPHLDIIHVALQDSQNFRFRHPILLGVVILHTWQGSCGTWQHRQILERLSNTPRQACVPKHASQSGNVQATETVRNTLHRPFAYICWSLGIQN